MCIRDRSWKPYFTGEFNEDDVKLLDSEMHRLGNVVIPFENYGGLIEEKVRAILSDLYESGVRKLATYELSWYLGERAVNETSFLYWAAKRKIPVIVPAPMDGAVGSQLWLFQQTHRDFSIDVFKDESLLSDLVFESKRSGALIIGGGVSKHHLLWWNQFKGGLDYAVQVTTSTEYDGSLSGARLNEAVSWRKVSKKAKIANVIADATVAIPLMLKAALEGRS